jgi:hypothetical protein
MWQLLKEFPRDLMSLKRAQLMCLYKGQPELSLKFVEQVSNYPSNLSPVCFYNC